MLSNVFFVNVFFFELKKLLIQDLCLDRRSRKSDGPPRRTYGAPRHDVGASGYGDSVSATRRSHGASRSTSRTHGDPDIDRASNPDVIVLT